MRSITDFIDQHPITYIGACCAAGLLLRLAMCHGDLHRFCSITWIPLIHQW
jgi:hypothetical protein